MSLERRLRRLEEATQEETMTLVCPTCGEELVAYGDVPMEYIVYQWTRETGDKEHHETPEAILHLFAYEHDPGALVEKTSGLPFLSRAVSGIDIGAGAGDYGGY